MSNLSVANALAAQKGRRILIALGSAVGILLVIIVRLAEIVNLFGIGLPSPMETLESEQEGFSIVYPRSWIVRETPGGYRGDDEIIAIISRLGYSHPVIIISQREFVGGDIIDVTEWGRSRIKGPSPYYVYTLLEARKLDSGKYIGILHEYYLEKNNLFGKVLSHCQDWYVLPKNTGYTLSLCVNESGWSQVQPVFQEMIRSFVVK